MMITAAARVLLVALALLMPLLMGASTAADSAPSKLAETVNAYLILDYLPPAIYEGDALSVCFRVESAGLSSAALELRGRAFDAAGKELKTISKKVQPAPGEFASATLDFETETAARITVELLEGTVATAAFAAVLQREDAPWPETRAAQGRLVLASNGDTLVPLVRKKRAVEERAFAPLDWVLGRGAQSAPARDGKTLLFAPAKWALKLESIAPLGPFSASDGTPMLRAMDAILSACRQQGAAKISRVVILLPPEDLELGTDSRTYHLVLNALLARLHKAGVAQTLLFAPFKFGCNEAHRGALWKEAHASAALYAAHIDDPADWMAPAAWLADPNAPGAFAPQPNAAGRKMIEQALSDLIK